MAKKTAFMRWVDGRLRSDKALARRVEALVNEMKIEQELVALREKRGLQEQADEREQDVEPVANHHSSRGPGFSGVGVAVGTGVFVVLISAGVDVATGSGGGVVGASVATRTSSGSRWKSAAGATCTS